MILTGDCLEVMPTLEAGSVDAVVTDPPYGLGFMGKAWDASAGPGDSPMRRRPEQDAVNAGMSRQGGRQWAGLDGQRRQARDAREYGAWCESWAAAMLRLAKPSAYLLAFGGTRTVHRMTCAIEDAGWIVRDMLVWAYASGFPKSKASLKPAWEPIVMARKPGPLRELAIDACRIGTDGGGGNGLGSHFGQETVPGHRFREGEPSAARRYGDNGVGFQPTPGPRGGNSLGRWPSNVILTSPIFDGGWDGVVGGGETAGGNAPASGPSWSGPTGEDRIGFQRANGAGDREPAFYGDSGTYSRFFLIPKADRAEREPLYSDLPERVISVWGGDEDDLTPGKKSTIGRRNTHPTVKPLELMRHLVRLVTPTDGLILDPFLGSGTTAIAAEMEGFRWIGIEREPEYVRIAEARLHGTQRGMGLPA